MWWCSAYVSIRRSFFIKINPNNSPTFRMLQHTCYKCIAGRSCQTKSKIIIICTSQTISRSSFFNLQLGYQPQFYLMRCMTIIASESMGPCKYLWRWNVNVSHQRILGSSSACRKEYIRSECMIFEHESFIFETYMTICDILLQQDCIPVGCRLRHPPAQVHARIHTPCEQSDRRL